jgi:hypothetical protein
MRRARVRSIAGRPLRPVGADPERPPISAERFDFLRKEAEELFWNELAWEELTDEEVVAGGHLTELVFPAFLAFIDALLPGKRSSAYPSIRAYPEVVESILTFLGERLASFTADLEGGADSQQVVWARAMTADLIDLVLYRLYRLSPAERDHVDFVA